MNVDIVILICIGVVTGSAPSCNREYVLQPQGNLSSPKYPLPHPPNMICNYYIRVNDGDHVSFKMNTMQVANDAGHDFLLFFDGNDCMSRRLGVFNQNSLWALMSSGSEMSALFLSDMGMPGIGFTGGFVAESAVSPGKLMHHSLFFSPNGGDALLHCGGELPAHDHEFSVPPTTRRPSVCIWRITAASNQIISIKISGIQAFVSHDWLRVLDGGGCDKNTLLYVHSVTTQKEVSVNTTGNQAIILVVRQPTTTTPPGFSVSYTLLRNPLVKKPISGNLLFYHQYGTPITSGSMNAKFCSVTVILSVTGFWRALYW